MSGFVVVGAISSGRNQCRLLVVLPYCIQFSSDVTMELQKQLFLVLIRIPSCSLVCITELTCLPFSTMICLPIHMQVINGGRIVPVWLLCEFFRPGSDSTACLSVSLATTWGRPWRFCSSRLSSPSRKHWSHLWHWRNDDASWSNTSYKRRWDSEAFLSCMKLYSRQTRTRIFARSSLIQKICSKASMKWNETRSKDAFKNDSWICIITYANNSRRHYFSDGLLCICLFIFVIFVFVFVIFAQMSCPVLDHFIFCIPWRNTTKGPSK